LIVGADGRRSRVAQLVGRDLARDDSAAHVLVLHLLRKCAPGGF
jgi:hypothetical protein